MRLLDDLDYLGQAIAVAIQKRDASVIRKALWVIREHRRRGLP